jgi:hypothetical protein
VRYFANLTSGRIALWFFLIWYLATVIHHFDPASQRQPSCHTGDYQNVPRAFNSFLTA